MVRPTNPLPKRIESEEADHSANRLEAAINYNRELLDQLSVVHSRLEARLKCVMSEETSAEELVCGSSEEKESSDISPLRKQLNSNNRMLASRITGLEHLIDYRLNDL